MTIDWSAQWEAHAPDFDGRVSKISLPRGKTIELLPGPGFGDRSHPTTRLMLALLAPLVPSKTVFDIGCGSGILSLASAALGARAVYACDIDPSALSHTAANSAHNNLPISTNAAPKSVDIILMNMITSEQRKAWKTHSREAAHLVTSGILESEKEAYLTAAAKEGWQLAELVQEEGWVAIYFQSTKPPSPV